MKQLNEIIKTTKEMDSLKKEAYSSVKNTPEWKQYEQASEDFKILDSNYKAELENIQTNTETEDFKISVSVYVDKKFNLEKFKEENQELFEIYCEEVPVWKRRVTVKKTK